MFSEHFIMLINNKFFLIHPLCFILMQYFYIITGIYTINMFLINISFLFTIEYYCNYYCVYLHLSYIPLFLSTLNALQSIA